MNDSQIMHNAREYGMKWKQREENHANEESLQLMAK